MRPLMLLFAAFVSGLSVGLSLMSARVADLKAQVQELERQVGKP